MLFPGRIAAALISGALLAQAHGLHPFWPLAWAAPIPLLIAVIGASRATAFLCGAIAGALSVAGMFAYMLDLSGPAPLAVFIVFKGLIWGGAALAASFADRHLPPAAAVFVFPALMAGVETLLAAISPHGTAGALAYSQMNFLPAIQVASLGGAPAVTFVPMLFGSLVAMLIARRAFAAALVPLVLIGAALGFGYWRLSLPPAAETVRVALLAADRFEGVPDDWRAVWAAYAPQIERAADQDYRIVLMPEKIARLSADERDAAVEQLAEIARRRDVHLIFGVDAETGEGRFNRAYVASSGLPIASYDKRHMIPGFESHFTPGRASLQSGEAPARFGYAICKDMDFPAVGRAQAGADIVFVPAWDFGVDAWLHSRMAVLRGVENGYAVVRSAREGVLTVSDAYGRVLAEAQSGPQAALNTQAPLGRPGPTLYARVGDVFGGFCVAAGLLLAGWAIWRGRREA
ncbi:MAG: apolipoprotein N-acyltransferase [Vitreimonas sp.]